MLLSFSLSMPSNNAWDGRWSGDGKCYVRVRSFRSKADIKRATTVAEAGYFQYAFGDGWVAGVTVKEVTSDEAKKLRALSLGFYGYDWMIDSILEHGHIRARRM